jgi:DNA-binding FrmR family transcriptional regulator
MFDYGSVIPIGGIHCREGAVNEGANKQLKTRLNRIAGQVSGIQKMLDEDRYCVDILNQIAAVRSALDAVGIELLTSHVESCVLGHGTESEHACARPMTQEELLGEVRTVLSRFLK